VKKQSYLLTFAVASALSASSNNLSAQMEETITYGTRINYYYSYYDPWGGNWAGDYDRSYEPDEYYDNDNVLACNDLQTKKPEDCTSDPGPVSNYLNAAEMLMGGELFLNGGLPNYLAYRTLFVLALSGAIESYFLYQDAYSATQVFLDAAADSCINGGGADIDAPTMWPVSNEVYCLRVAGELSEGLVPNYSWYTRIGGAVNLGILSIDLSLSPWGNELFGGLDRFMSCRAWYNSYNLLGC